MKKERLYPCNNPATGIWMYREDIEILYDSFSENGQYDINDILEYIIVSELIDSGNRHVDWDEERYQKLVQINKIVKRSIGKYFNSFTDKSLFDAYPNIDNRYIELFWRMFEKYKLYETISSSTLSKIIDDALPIWHILKNKNTVKAYDAQLAECLREKYEDSAELIITNYLEDNSTKYFFPNSLLKSEYEGIFMAYILSDLARLSYLDLLINSNSNGDCPISDDVKIAAIDKRDLLLKEVYTKHVTVTGSSIGVEIKNYDGPIVEVHNDGLDYTITLNGNELRKEMGYVDILFNFIYLLNIVDKNGCCSLIAKPGEIDAFERLMGLKGKDQYLFGTAFRVANTTAELLLVAYYSFLDDNGVNIEKVFKWFFEDYLKDEYSAKGFEFSVSSPGTTYLEKNRNLSSEMEAIIEQFNLFVVDGYVNRRKFELSSNHIDYSKINSLIPNKYAKVVSDKLNTIIQLLFSDQSSLNYYPPTESGYKSFAELLRLEEPQLNDFHDYQVAIIQQLVDESIIIVDSSGQVKLEPAVFIWMYDSYLYGYIPYYSFGEVFDDFAKVIADSMQPYIDAKEIVMYSHLLSGEESDYFNYNLNRRKYGNGLDLKNKYSHGTASHDEEKQKELYIKLLKLMILLIIKINDEFYFMNKDS